MKKYSTETPPTHGYILPKGYGLGKGYRATAIAYCQRNGLNEVANNNGFTYTLKQLIDARI